MNFIFKIYIVSICLAVLLAKKHRKGIKRENEDSPEDTSNSRIDLRGNLLKTLFVFCGHPAENSVCSPLSALMPLAKLALGAEGQTQEELIPALGVSRMSKIRNRFKPLLVELRYLPGGKLDIASRLYVSQTAHLHRPFVDQSRDIFGSSAVKLDFQNSTYAAEEINLWVSSQTNHMIKDIVAPFDISPTTSLVLVNAVYFSGRWKEPFDKVDNKTFYSPMGSITVPMMTRSGYYNYTTSDALSAEIIEIPYLGEKASFVIVLPTTQLGLSILLSQLKLAPELLDSAMASMHETNVDLNVPKFRIESTSNLRELYEVAGVKKIFDTKDSGLTKITRDGSVYVTSAKQKAFIDVHQFGSEAGASSSISMSKLSYQKPLRFNADHPFLFFILVKKEQLFSGTLLYPPLSNQAS
ncbi:antichymotrypsin-2-like [Maniola hyperantus]|uniref:antichymotrypsin-2-like n=1 Tax=Aphantopus hyperantus TaxID=2795564 RepID=UPI0037478AC0